MDIKDIVELVVTVNNAVNGANKAAEDKDKAIAARDERLGELQTKLDRAEEHISRCERTLATVAKIATTEAQENWPNVKERLWALTAEFADAPRFDVGPLKPFSKDHDKIAIPREG